MGGTSYDYGLQKPRLVGTEMLERDLRTSRKFEWSGIYIPICGVVNLCD